MNIFCAFYWNAGTDGQHSFNVLKYNPFEAFKLIKLSQSKSLLNYFSDSMPDYRRHSIRTQRVSKYKIFFLDIKFWLTVSKAFNASMSFQFVTEAEHQEAERMKRDITLYEILLQKYVHALYPHRQSSIVLIVPHAKPYTDFVAYLQNGTWKLLFVFVLIVMVSSSLLLTVSHYMKEKKILLLRHVVGVINLLVNDNMAIRYRDLSIVDGFVIVPLTFTGIIVMNGIMSLLWSYLTSPIYQPQINTLSDLYRSPIPILSNEIKWKTVHAEMLEDITRIGGWSDKVHGVDVEQLRIEMQTFNSSIAFFLHDNEAQIYLKIQKQRGLRVYHLLGDANFGRDLMSFEVNPEFPFTEQINNIIHRLNAAGLMDKWLQEDNRFLMRSMLKRNQLKNQQQPDVSGFSVMNVVYCGWMVGTIAFIAEIVWNKIHPRKFNNSKRNFRTNNSGLQ